jgi:flagellar biosynthetic protein FliR
MATLLFLALDGHLVAIEVLARSFELLPLGVEGLSREALWQLAVWGVHMYAGAVLIALPAVISMLLVNIAFGVITRAAPQLNIFAVGFPMTLMIGFLLLMVTLPSLIPQVSDLMMDAFNLIGSLLVGG